MKKKTSSRQASSAEPARGSAARADLPLFAMVMRAAAQVCDAFGDSPDARAAMKRDVQTTPPELLPDLLKALTQERPQRAKAISPTDRPPTQKEQSE